MECERLAGLIGEVHDLRHAAQRQRCHDRVRADSLSQARGPRRCLGRHAVPLDERYATPPLREVICDAGAKRSGADDDGISFYNHGLDPPGGSGTRPPLAIDWRAASRTATTRAPKWTSQGCDGLGCCDCAINASSAARWAAIESSSDS